MGSVVEMQTFRTFLLAIVATAMLVGGIASTANADTPESTTHAAPAAVDPGDPGIPPD
jgi:glycerol uptake facilitator-like aquaporin